jgi:hypothetical protein
VDDVTDVSERSAPGADMGRISAAAMIRTIWMIFGGLNKGDLSRAARLKGPVQQVYNRARGLSKG